MMPKILAYDENILCEEYIENIIWLLAFEPDNWGIVYKKTIISFTVAFVLYISFSRFSDVPLSSSRLYTIVK